MRLVLLLIVFIVLGIPSTAGASQDVLVVLPNGLKQRAVFVGVQSDTVVLGGVVNGQPTTVKIPRNRIKALLALPDSTPIDIQTPPSSSSLPQSSSSSTEAPMSSQELESEGEHDWLGHLLVLPPESQTLDSLALVTIQNYMVQLLREQSEMPVLALQEKDLRQFATSEQLFAEVKKAQSPGLIGSQWKSKKDSVQITFKSILVKNDSLTSKSETKTLAGKAITTLLRNDATWRGLEKVLSISLISKPEAQLQGQQYVFVETEPDGALIGQVGVPPVCKSPCKVPVQPDSSNRVQLRASWKVMNHLWAGKSTMVLGNEDTLKSFIQLEPSHATLQIMTIPAGATIYPGETAWSPSIKPLGKTPLAMQEFDPGELQFLLSYPGYKDTVIRIVPDPIANTEIIATLHPISDRNELAAQNARLHAMSRNHIGKALMGASLAPVLVGATFLWLARSDYDRAANIKEELEQPSAVNGPNFKSRLEDNHQAVKDGDQKVKIGAALLVSGAVFLGVGFSLWF